MSREHTQQQTSEEMRRAQKLSLQRTQPPIDVPGYVLQQFLGSGAYGEVWVGADRNTGRRVAVKFYTHRGGLDWSLLSRETEKLVFLSADRYVVQLLDVGWSSDPPYYVMEYIEHGSLEDLLAERGPLPLAEAVELFEDIAVGLMHAHGKGVLHCDLKPANILLDQDLKPRLADFGQSRLSHEQTPALGTLFYMAPEQADLTAVPDARWDVYALGAILYCMLTGEPPHRNEHAVEQIETAKDLDDRLARYRHLIHSSPPPRGHLRLRGMDRSLGEIIDRCLSADPHRRLANVQEVLDALRARAAAQRRRPLMVLGIVGPILLLCIMAFFGWRGYEQARQDSTDAIRKRAYESNEFAAKFVARTLESEIERYFSIVQREAQKADFRRLFAPVAAQPQVAELNLLGRPATDQGSPPDQDQVDALRQKLIIDPQQIELRDYLQRRLGTYSAKLTSDNRAPKFASIFVTDAEGTILAAVYDNDVPTKSVGRNYAWRTYFHGGPADLPQDKRRPEVTPIQRTHLSNVFRSTTTRLWKVAVSTPILDETAGEAFRGVMVFTVNVGDFEFLRNNNRNQLDRFAVLVDGREGRGTILQHPLYAGPVSDPNNPGDENGQYEYRVTPEQLAEIQSNRQFKYQDPLGASPEGTEFRGDWIAALGRVKLPEGEPDSDLEPAGGSQESDLIVLVQERDETATSPVRQLGNRLVGTGMRAFAAVVCVVVVLWYFVLRLVSDPGGSDSGRKVPAAPSTPLFDRTTLAAPKQKPMDA